MAQDNLTQAASVRGPLEGEFVVGEWWVMPAANRLRRLVAGGGVRGGEDSGRGAARNKNAERQVEPRLMRLLCVLAANGGEVLGRERLMDELWPQVIVSENSLTRAVSELRRLLAVAGETGSDLRYIETVSKKGYRLVQEVIPQERDSQARGGESTCSLTEYPLPVRLRTTPWAHWLPLKREAWGMAVAGGAAVAVLGLLLIGLFAGGDSRGFQPFEYSGLQVASLSADGSEDDGIEALALAPDGRNYAYIRHASPAEGAGSAVYVGNLQHPDAPQVVYRSERALSNLVWSPLGDALIFARQPAGPTHAVVGLLGDGFGEKDGAELLQLDLHSLEVQRLLPQADVPPQETPAADRI